jgi:ACS family tartrate transporter-like MFS transporter
LHRGSSFGNLGVGFLTTIPYLFTIVAMLLSGYHSDRTNERCWHVAIPAFLGAVALVLAGHTANVTALVACFSVAFAGALSMNGPFWALSTRMFSGAAAAAGIALINSVGNLGSGLGPYTIGYVKDRTGNFQLALLLVAIVLTVGGLTVLYVRSISTRR